MAKKEATTDILVYELLKDANLNFDYQGSNIKEIDEALKTASKNGKGNVGFPEYVGVVKDYLIVIEDKADLTKHIKEENDVVSMESKDVVDYAVNGALFYAQHLAKNTSYKKLFAFGVSGDEKHHRITPIFVDRTSDYRILSDLESFISINNDNIDEYYTKEIQYFQTPVHVNPSQIHVPRQGTPTTTPYATP